MPVAQVAAQIQGKGTAPFEVLNSDLGDREMGMIVLVRGSLRGMGHEVECEVVAMKRTVLHPPKERPQIDEVYSDCGVLNAPQDLPDGEYTVRVGNQLFSTRRRRGLWLGQSKAMAPSLVAS